MKIKNFDIDILNGDAEPFGDGECCSEETPATKVSQTSSRGQRRAFRFRHDSRHCEENEGIL